MPRECRICGSDNRASSCHCSVCGEILKFTECIHSEDSRWGLKALEIDTVINDTIRRSRVETRATLSQLSLF